MLHLDLISSGLVGDNGTASPLLGRLRCGDVTGDDCFKHSTSSNTTCAPPPLVGITFPLYKRVSTSPSVSAACDTKQYFDVFALVISFASVNFVMDFLFL